MIHHLNIKPYTMAELKTGNRNCIFPDWEGVRYEKGDLIILRDFDNGVYSGGNFPMLIDEAIYSYTPKSITGGPIKRFVMLMLEKIK